MVSYSEFPGYLGNLLKRVEGETSYSIRVVAKVKPPYDCEIRCARRGRPFHLLTYDWQHEQHLEHFLVNGCVKIVRLWSVPSANRYLPMIKSSFFPEREHAELRRKVRALYPEVSDASLRNTSRFLYSGIARQLISIPIDIRVERE